jgi:hypothetical protein
VLSAAKNVVFVSSSAYGHCTDGDEMVHASLLAILAFASLACSAAVADDAFRAEWLRARRAQRLARRATSPSNGVCPPYSTLINNQCLTCTEQGKANGANGQCGAVRRSPLSRVTLGELAQTCPSNGAATGGTCDCSRNTDSRTYYDASANICTYQPQTRAQDQSCDESDNCVVAAPNCLNLYTANDFTSPRVQQCCSNGQALLATGAQSNGIYANCGAWCVYNRNPRELQFTGRAQPKVPKSRQLLLRA